MALLDRFRPDVSEGWPRAAAHSLEWDVQRGAIDGVALGAPAAALEVFGRPDNPRPVLHGRFVYYELGFVVELERGVVDYMGCIFADLEEQGFAPCRVKASFEAGHPILLNKDSDPESVLDLLGEPEKVDRDAEETRYTYRRPKHGIELELTSASRLGRVNLVRT